MNTQQALDYAQACYIPELVFGGGYEVMEAERLKGEEAMKLLIAAWHSEERPQFSFELVRDLGDRNRALCDAMGEKRVRAAAGGLLTRALPDEDSYRAIGALQNRQAAAVEREVRGDRKAIGVAWVREPVGGIVLGIDIETTGRTPERAHIVNVGWEFMELAAGAEPYGGESCFCGLPDLYRDEGVPLSFIHHITWDDIEGNMAFRENKVLQARLLELMRTYPYLAHNAAFEDSWFTIQLDGYAEARRAGEIVVVDTREICRRLDGDVPALPRESKPASLENWARRRGTLRDSEDERHLGLEDADLMLRTVQAEFARKNMFASRS
ncbi:DNA polymerase III epsilon subunit-like 3'-5' exonuclease [Coriobacterium glomerans PW2]|uniref:DNA polymerase III epsilon subunit-like 3'-5' exonuclease n=1 Tax=Coriobacterium glomerans (strain ATCC 49209 / DSM 20642 / JCM 10262 / PW2) TaxID=700015 RepID=F2NBL4_CORGP|nr:DNA polymerase [Coriobacterium glomerans]AEB06750.1 DNA polymerase III epsilon subunit-like 3'-5' exonuclease [Coriobacterium glomerans PW2]